MEKRREGMVEAETIEGLKVAAEAAVEGNIILSRVP